MRVFISVTQDLKKVASFQKTIPYLLGVLKERLPERYLFAFEDVPETENPPFSKTSMGKLIKAFPPLQQYLRLRSEKRPEVSIASNFPAVSRFAYVQPELDEAVTPELLTAVVEKIPRPYSFYNVSIVLDSISWFGDSNTIPALSYSMPDAECAADGINSCGSSSFYQSDCIVLEKSFDYGTGYNPLHLRFEVTQFIEEGTLSQADTQIEELCTRFGGQFMSRQMVCCFSPQEMLHFEAAAKQLGLYLQSRSKAWSELSMPSGIPFGKESYQSIPGIQPEQNYCTPNRISYFKKVLREDGFIWRHPKIDGYCEFAKILTEGNYVLNISPWFQRNYLYIRLDCSGYNFTVNRMVSSDRICHSMKELELFAADLKMLISLWVNEVVPEIRRLFGDTPSWYAHSIVFDSYTGSVPNIEG
ncbi:hypothetical protein SAMN02745136_03602 [Anaerocolumna jejuensis DSM 15929]|uniref:Uncharacterized protein n=1 Tax=Anaerocolumna jejuensis DSM 15929 TaxID=1121322 RepID=A0A1M6W6B4_9FIRM|nr:hypothetical protein [Anaerocolumna jejuensis]SHK89324.1 hypothetical protein SAMN02745136_03602 [Anaerocolumna jejuensis DSM 15929]